MQVRRPLLRARKNENHRDLMKKPRIMFKTKEKNMNEENKRELKDNKKDKKKEPEGGLPFCTTAASAEQARAEEEDEPCDDGRTGNVE